MISKFRKFIEKEGLFKEDDKILLASSGGIDSMVLADLMLINENKFGIAHINHQTRGIDSEDDLKFIAAFCAKHNIEFHSASAPIEKMAKEAKENFHAYARAYRYDFFNKILDDHNYDYIATAHHNSDSLETFFINLTRGAGLDGLTGIPIKNKNVIRPLLFASKDDIITYAKKFKIAYREDASNNSKKYKRNHIRHELIPKLHEIDKDAITNAKSSIEKLQDTKSLLSELIGHQNFVSRIDDRFSISKKTVEEFTNKYTLLYYLIKAYGFNFSQCTQIIESIKNVGATFESPTHNLLIDREKLIIEKLTERISVDLKIDSTGTFNLPNGQTIRLEETSELDATRNSEYFDREKLAFPLTIRNWTNGDKFAPLGMGGKSKKVKEFLIDKKINRLDKKDQLVLESNNEIAWLIGLRISENFKYTDITTGYLKFTLLD